MIELERRCVCGNDFGRPEDRTTTADGDRCRPCADRLDKLEGRPPCVF